ncbi:MAG: hypothetical protein K2L51_01870 [Clostridiales bacterium]|nr:hypothetical protein [Clostridiales bacterium]
MDAQKKATIKKRIPRTALTAAVVPFIVFFVVPFEIYCTNRDEFLFSAGAFLPVLLLYMLLFAAGLFAALLFLPPRAYKISCNVWLMLGVLFFLQGTYLNRGMAAFSTNGAGGNETVKIVFNTILWIVLIGGAVACAWLPDKKEIVPTVSMILAVVVLATQAVGFVKTSVTNKEVFSSKSQQVEQTAENPKRIFTADGLTTMSRNKNILYFVFDRFDEFFAEATQKYAYDEFYKDLDGFVGYTDHLSLYGHTYPSISYMITGNEHDPDKSRIDHLNSVYRNDNTVSTLAQNDWDTRVFTEQYYGYTVDAGLPECIGNVSAVKSVKVRNPFMIGIHLTHMALYRCVPAALKNCMGIINANQCNRNVQYWGANGAKEYAVDNKAAYKLAAEQPFTLTDRNVFKFIHIQGIHDYMGSLETRTLDKKTRTVKNAVKGMRESMAVANLYINFLKENGLYENATIIITGDHPSPYYNFGEIEAPKLTGLYVKKAGSAGTPFALLNAQVSHENLWPAVMQEAGVEMPPAYGTSLFDIREDEQRTRRFIWHTYLYRSSLDVYNYTVTGSGRDFANWKLDGEPVHYNRGIMG